MQVAHLVSAWDDNLELSNDGASCSALLTTLHTSLHTLVRSDDSDSEDQQQFGISFAPYTPPNLSVNMPDNGFWVTGQCLLCHQGVEGGDSTPENYCVFLFEVRTQMVTFLNVVSNRISKQSLTLAGAWHPKD